MRVQRFLGGNRRDANPFQTGLINTRIQRVCAGQNSDQDQQQQSHALLAVVGTVGETDAGAGQDQQPANPDRRRLILGRRLIERLLFDQRLRNQKHSGGHKSPRRVK